MISKTQREFPLEKENTFSQNANSIISQSTYYYFPDASQSNSKNNQTPITAQTQSNNQKDFSMNLEAQQHTTNKKQHKSSKNYPNILEFSNNSAKTQVITANSNQKIDSKTSSSDCLDLNFSHTMVPENNELMCQENLPVPSEEFAENTFFPQTMDQENFEKHNQIQEEINKIPVFQQESGFEFTQETLEHLIQTEYEYSSNCNYFKTIQKTITPYMRAILMDWMMEVCNEFTLKRETFHLSVNYVDRVLSLIQNVQKTELQLIGVVSMFIASKIEVFKKMIFLQLFIFYVFRKFILRNCRISLYPLIMPLI